MGNPRTLPPLVRGKVTGVLDFFIDEILICKNVLYLTENLDFIAQVRWWGEVLPACIRPKILRLKSKIISSSHSIQAYSHSVQYEIRTSVDLLKSYLKACEVVELSVYEAVENYVIGSAFLKNLSNLLNRNNDFISMPIIDYLGEEIGQIKIHVNFFENPQNNRNQICKNKICEINLGISEKGVPEVLKRNYILPAEKTIFYDGYSKITNFEVECDQNSEFDRHLVKDKNNASDLVLSDYDSETAIKNLTNPSQESSKCTILPKVCSSRDSSKILKFDLGLKIKDPEKSNKSKLASRFTSNSLRSKSKPKNEKLCLGISTNKEEFSKKTVLKNLPLKKSNAVTTNQVDSKIPSRKQSNESCSSKNSELENISQTCNNKMVFDYLLGSVMTKENEESAVNYFKKMSPSHDIVCSINELCLSSDETEVFANKCMKHNLCFDLTNPIERNYYEKFFVKNNSKDFEIAEFLNEPENSCGLQKLKSSDRNSQKNSFKVGNGSVDETLISKCDNLSRLDKITNNCAQCKYYKKLDELDTIIESLKHFEKNLLKQEKSLQLEFEDNVNKQDWKLSDR